MKHTCPRFIGDAKENKNYMQMLKQRIIKEEIEIISVYSVSLWQGIYI